MPQLNPQTKTQVTSVREGKPFRERLRERYSPTDFVRVMNIDTAPFEWQYFPVDGEDISFTDNGAVRVVVGRQHFDKRYENVLPGNEQIWSISPGDSEVLLGANADLFIEGLYKQMIAKKVLLNKSDGEKSMAKSFNFSDGLMQEKYIDEIFLGVERPNFGEKHAAPASTTRKEK